MIGPPEKTRRTALGRGLSALLSEATSSRGVVEIPISRIVVPPQQPRTYFDPRSLDELRLSIAQHGLLQPLVVRPLPGGNYELIAGERRLRALKMLGWETAPALVHDGNTERLELSLIENIQRENLSPVEEARAFLHLMDALKLTQEELGERLKKSRPYVANKVRLLHLPEEIQVLLLEGKLSEGHARALLSLKDRNKMLAMAQEILSGKLNVREVERRVRKARTPPTKGPAPKTDAVVRALEDTLGTPVQHKRRKGGGVIQIIYHSEEKLSEILRKITGKDLPKNGEESPGD